MQPHGISANIATAISESATFVNVMAFLHPCTVYSKQVTHSGTSQHEYLGSGRFQLRRHGSGRPHSVEGD